jgi:hypothetical protein
MTIVSFSFAAFTACALLLYHVVPVRLRTVVLLAFSYAFCASLGFSQLAILVALTAGNLAIGARVASDDPRRRAWLWGGIALNVGLLLAMRELRGGGPAIIAGLSFYSVQAISYLADTYSGALRVQPALATFALYLAYFPKFLAGPIERPRAFFERLAGPKAVDDESVAEAATLIVTGMVRKLVIADPLGALLPADAFAPPLSLSPGSKAFALVVYAFVLYNDFAGYTAIVRGVSRLFGIDLSPNFQRPFFAATFSEFWTRWHITLSNWLRDYIYMPVEPRAASAQPRSSLRTQPRAAADGRDARQRRLARRLREHDDLGRAARRVLEQRARRRRLRPQARTRPAAGMAARRADRDGLLARDRVPRVLPDGNRRRAALLHHDALGTGNRDAARTNVAVHGALTLARLDAIASRRRAHVRPLAAARTHRADGVRAPTLLRDEPHGRGRAVHLPGVLKLSACARAPRGCAPPRDRACRSSRP